jgi:hypothetical protein
MKALIVTRVDDDGECQTTTEFADSLTPEELLWIAKQVRQSARVIEAFAEDREDTPAIH